MRYRTFGRLGWRVSDIGHGLWGMGGWSGSDDRESLQALERSFELGCNFFDTALAYGNGHSERLLAQLISNHGNERPYVATKVPPMNQQWPATAATPLEDVFPATHIRKSTEDSLRNLGVECIDLQQFHVWTDEWSRDERWKREIERLKSAGLIRAFGISVNRWQAENVLEALDSGLVDAVQVVYNIFDQAPEDELFPACERLNIAVIARVPFDEGSLTGTLVPEMRWPDGDWRNIYFTAERLQETLERVDRLTRVVPAGSDLPDTALRFILQHPAVSTTIPGMRSVEHVERNVRSSNAGPLADATYESLRHHRWDRNTIIP